MGSPSLSVPRDANNNPGDEEQPICDGCRKQNRDCVWGWNVKFVHGVRTTRQTANDEWDGSSDYRFRKGQRWVPVHVTPSKSC